jgi:hypothetical protein
VTRVAHGARQHPSVRHPWTADGLDRFAGLIAAGGFASGEQVVVGLWRTSPLGRFVDAMWVRPDGERVLLAPSEAVRRYVASLYTFERTEVVSLVGGWTGRRVEVTAGPVRLTLDAGGRDWRSWLFAARPLPLRRSPRWLAVEDRLVAPLGGFLLRGTDGVRLAGTAPGGQREWYGIDDYRPLTRGTLTVDGTDAGALTTLRADLGVGLSAFPSVPALVNVTTLVEPVGRSRRG